MADLKISALTSATTPLAGTEVLPIVQSSTTKKVSTDDLTVKNFRSNATSGILQVAGPAAASTRVMTTPDANYTVARTDTGQTFTGNNLFNNPSASAIATFSNGSGRGTVDINGKDDLSLRLYRNSVQVGAISTDSGGTELYFGTTTSLPLYLYTNNTNRVTIAGAGNVTVNTGNLVIGTSGKGIDFSATSGSGTSELLADYEEGTFTAVITMDSGTATVSSANDLMSYTKVGRLVTINGQFHISATSTPSGAMKITLPFSVANGSEGSAFSVGGAMRIFNQVLPVGLYPIIQANNNDNTATFFMVTSAGTLTNMLPIADGFFMISLTYIV
jgi:hypothetical protein